MSLLESAVQFVFIALSVASVYLLVALGLSIVFGSLQFINMAHGALYLIGAYVGLLVGYEIEFGGLLASYGLSPLGIELGFLAALVVTPVVVFGLGVVMERLLADPLYDRSLLDQLLVTFGILLIFQEGFNLVFGRTGFNYPRPGWASGPVLIPGVGAVSRWRAYVVFLTLVFLGIIIAFYKYTDYGLAVRAGTEDTEMTELLGIRIGRPFLLIFAIGASYAGLAGILGGSLFGVNAGMGFANIIPALVIVIMGGVGSIKGTTVGALLAGFVFATVTQLWPSMATASIYALAIVILTVRPSGIYPTGEIGQ
ncbi:branched-chain amino acid ABC transporter permease [Halomicrobium urmianum]|uniref:branched-chain amino acid ABC transporter permease n=1 Tax=Halomicrobium urmianum TaxID=1586233 RepID=UPI001CD92EBD|nr:branched-chain amino acid ABC transporter permease [Halomicrobium urmianum]